MPTLVHLIYVHGFQGNDTTFQSFPKHLQEYLAAQTPPHLDIKFQSSLYPTYRSVKPISYATKNFLEWLTTQPPGPVILLGHSMGGLLVADAATDVSNNFPGNRPKRIVGVVAFDTPYLGMHPHVVITGIASLLPKCEEEKEEKSEGAMNDHPQVNIIDDKVTDDWEAFKKQEHIHPKRPAYGSDGHSSFSQNTSSTTQSTPSMYSRTSSPPPTFMDKALGFVSTHSDDPIVRWLKKHSNEPFSAGKRWIVERFQFGICMFDPPGLKDRYERLVEWKGGKWVNYWTTTVPKVKDTKHVGPAEASGSHTRTSTSTSSKNAGRIDNDEALVANGIVPPSTSTTPQQQTPSKEDPNGKEKKEEIEEESTETLEEPPPVYTDEPSEPAEQSEPPEHGPPTKSQFNAAQKQAVKEQKEAEKAAKKEQQDKENAKKKELKEMENAKKKEQKEIENAKKKEQKEIENARKREQKELARQEKENKPKPARHFVVLPNGLGEFLGGKEKWEQVPIEGVEDEVGAHLGLFIPDHNRDYEGLVERVANTVFGWCEELPKTR